MQVRSAPCVASLDVYVPRQPGSAGRSHGGGISGLGDMQAGPHSKGVGQQQPCQQARGRWLLWPTLCPLADHLLP